jgi:multimeric flavodoxin WrbA
MEQELEQFKYMIEARDKIAQEREKRGLGEVTEKPKKKKIIGLSCGTKNGNCEFYLKAAAMGAEEFGVETEIIRAIELRIKPCQGCGADVRALAKGKLAVCPIKDDDVPWILEKTVVEDCGLIVSVPVYYVRSNAIFMAICERMHPTMFNHLEILKKRKVGAIISVGGGLDGWTSLGLTGVNIWVQHHRTLVDQLQVETRDRDTNWFERAKELGRNVARAMNMPIEEVKFMGEESAVSCPVCHGDVMQMPDYRPRALKPMELRYKPAHVVCPVCWVHGDLSFEGGKIKVKWDEWDVKHPRFSEYGVFEHLDMLIKMFKEGIADMDPYRELKKQVSSHGKIIKPEKS